jgi:hypothetical protein
MSRPVTTYTYELEGFVRVIVAFRFENPAALTARYLDDKFTGVIRAFGTPGCKYKAFVEGSWAQTRDSRDGFFSESSPVSIVKIGRTYLQLLDEETNDTVFVTAKGVTKLQIEVDIPKGK